MKLSDTEIWRQIPPEEKLYLLNRAHSRGAASVLIFLLIACTLAAGFKVSALMWSSFLLVPLIFQVAAGREWKSTRPNLVLRYLAARAAARRFAYAVNAYSLNLKLIFRGTMEWMAEEEENSEVGEAMRELEKAISDNNQTAVWVALFEDAVVLMKEEKGGARAEFVQLINDKISVERTPGSDDEDKVELLLKFQETKTRTRNIKLHSEQVAALVAFQQALNMLKENTTDRFDNFESLEAMNPAQLSDRISDLTGDFS